MIAENSIDYWKWLEIYKPLTNHFDKNAGIDGSLFLHFGEQWDFVNKYEPEYIWTLTVTDLDESTAWEISSGVHFVNCQGYLVTNVPYAEDIIITY